MFTSVGMYQGAGIGMHSQGQFLKENRATD